MKGPTFGVVRLLFQDLSHKRSMSSQSKSRNKIVLLVDESYQSYMGLTHWRRVTHVYASKITTIGPDNGSSSGRRQAIIWINAGILLIRTLGTNFSEVLSEINRF